MNIRGLVALVTVPDSVNAWTKPKAVEILGPRTKKNLIAIGFPNLLDTPRTVPSKILQQRDSVVGLTYDGWMRISARCAAGKTQHHKRVKRINSPSALLSRDSPQRRQEEAGLQQSTQHDQR